MHLVKNSDPSEKKRLDLKAKLLHSKKQEKSRNNFKLRKQLIELHKLRKRERPEKLRRPTELSKILKRESKRPITVTKRLSLRR